MVQVAAVIVVLMAVVIVVVSVLEEWSICGIVCLRSEHTLPWWLREWDREVPRRDESQPRLS